MSLWQTHKSSHVLPVDTCYYCQPNETPSWVAEHNEKVEEYRVEVKTQRKIRHSLYGKPEKQVKQRKQK